MVMYDDEYKTKENKNWTKDKIEPQHMHIVLFVKWKSFFLVFIFCHWHLHLS